MSEPQHVLVIGAGLAGLRTADGLRRAGYAGRISLVGAEDALPYDRPPLSKQYLAGDWDRERIGLVTTAGLADLAVRAHLGRSAVALRPGPESHEVELDDGTTLHADAVVLAVGVTARPLPGAQVLRTARDSDALREAIAAASSLLVIGAGFIGAEVASTALGNGTAVTVVEADATPLARVLGPRVGALAARLLTSGGADLRCGVAVSALTETGATLSDGSTVAAEVTVAGIGTRLDLGWLDSTGLDLTGGIPCDARGRVEGLDGVWAVGDSAAWTDPRYGDRVRHEHWTSATDQAAVVAADIAGAQPPPATVPYFWSDQFGMKIQLIGRPELADDLVPLHGDGFTDGSDPGGDTGGEIKGTTVGYLRGDELVAVAGFGAARRIARYRAPLSDRADRDALLRFRDSLT